MHVATSQSAALRLPSEDPPPIGKTLLLLTWEGCIVKGRWDDEGCCAWAPLPKETPEIKEARAEYWRTKANAGVYGGRGLL
jgi:hypothetical protein